MKTLLSFRFILAAFCIIFVTQIVKAQDDMAPPPPAKNETMEMLIGTWKSAPYQFMTAKWTDVAVHTMKHGGHFMFIDVNGENEKGRKYTITVIMKSDASGNLTRWSFDDWGGFSTYTGTSGKNKVTVNGKSDWGTETREIEINGNTMVHKVTINMKGPDGKDMTESTTVNYTKQ